MFLTYPRVISYRGASERAEDHSPRSGQMCEGFTDSFGVLHFLCLCLGSREERAGPGEGQARQGCFVLQNRAEKTSNTTQAMLCGGKSKTRARKPISLELFMLRNSNRPSRAELLSQARQRAAPSLDCGSERAASKQQQPNSRGHTVATQQDILIELL